MAPRSSRTYKASIDRDGSRYSSTPPKGRYVLRSGAFLSKKDANILAPILDEMAEQIGEVSEERLVQISEPERSPTHHLFLWDDQEAAHLHRLQQARTYIGAFDIIFEGTTEPVRAFPSVVRNGTRSYQPMGRVMSEQELFDQVVNDAVSQAQSWAHRHQALRNVGRVRGIFAAIEQAVAHNTSRRKTGTR